MRSKAVAHRVGRGRRGQAQLRAHGGHYALDRSGG
jgi:hypothetical protein